MAGMFSLIVLTLYVGDFVFIDWLLNRGYVCHLHLWTTVL